MRRRKGGRSVRGRGDDARAPPDAAGGELDADGGREDLDWSPGRLRAALEGIWRAAASLLEGASKERP